MHEYEVEALTSLCLLGPVKVDQLCVPQVCDALARLPPDVRGGVPECDLRNVGRQRSCRVTEAATEIEHDHIAPHTEQTPNPCRIVARFDGKNDLRVLDLLPVSSPAAVSDGAGNG